MVLQIWHLTEADGVLLWKPQQRNCVPTDLRERERHCDTSCQFLWNQQIFVKMLLKLTTFSFLFWQFCSNKSSCNILIRNSEELVPRTIKAIFHFQEVSTVVPSQKVIMFFCNSHTYSSSLYYMYFCRRLNSDFKVFKCLRSNSHLTFEPVVPTEALTEYIFEQSDSGQWTFNPFTLYAVPQMVWITIGSGRSQGILNFCCFLLSST